MSQQWPPQQPWQPQREVVQHKTSGAAKGCLMKNSQDLWIFVVLGFVFDIGHWVGGGVTGRQRYASA